MSDLFVHNQFVVFDYLQARLGNITIFLYYQIKNLANKLQRNNVPRRKLSRFEALLLPTGQFKTLSKVYLLLLSLNEVPDKNWERWQSDLQEEIDEQKEVGCKYTYIDSFK